MNNAFLGLTRVCEQNRNTSLFQWSESEPNVKRQVNTAACAALSTVTRNGLRVMRVV